MAYEAITSSIHASLLIVVPTKICYSEWGKRHPAGLLEAGAMRPG
ncbi:MAG TPA: hypothetical protein VKR06_45685 [Ktedonosporobacter sp.]|nr:hypothetical protein [Ktedonosporobacter sp.]